MKTLTAFITLVLFLAAPSAVFSQECPAVLDDALTSAAGCTSTEVNHVCFGHAPVDVLVDCEGVLDFSVPGDMIALDGMCQLASGAAQSTGEWGLAVMRVQPHGMGDTPLTMITVGDVEMLNAGSNVTTLEVEVISDLTLYAGPNSTYPAVGTLSVGDTVTVNACSCTRHWLRTILDDGQVGWMAAASVTILGEASALPIAGVDTPIYSIMQAFTLRTGAPASTCAGLPEDGVLIQSPADAEPVPVQVNGISMWVRGTAFVQAPLAEAQTVEVIAGDVLVIVDDFHANLGAGMRAVFPTSSAEAPAAAMHVEPFELADIELLPFTLLPDAVDLEAAFANTAPQVVGQGLCRVLSLSGESVCELYFVNRDGDAITQMDVAFVSAPQGEWEGSTHADPPIVTGSAVGGTLGWNITCSVGTSCFIGPIMWSITVTDAAGNVSEPFEAWFNCVDH